MCWAGSKSLPEYDGIRSSGRWTMVPCADCLRRVGWREIDSRIRRGQRQCRKEGLTGCIWAGPLSTAEIAQQHLKIFYYVILSFALLDDLRQQFPSWVMLWCLGYRTWNRVWIYCIPPEHKVTLKGHSIYVVRKKKILGGLRCFINTKIKTLDFSLNLHILHLSEINNYWMRPKAWGILPRTSKKKSGTFRVNCLWHKFRHFKWLLFQSIWTRKSLLHGETSMLFD